MLKHRPSRRALAGITASALIVAVIPALAAAPATAAAAPTELFISEYVEGTSSNKALEIFNGTGSAVTLTGAYTVTVYSNGGATGTAINLTGTVANGDVFVLANNAANATILAQTDQTSGSVSWNGNDAVVLRKSGVVIDVVGQVGFDPGANGWGTDPVNTMDNTIRRKATVTTGDSNSADAFVPAVEWDGFALDTFSGLGSHTVEPPDAVDVAPSVTGIVPADGATGVSAFSNIVITFSEPVTVTSSAFSLECASGTKTFSVSGTGATRTINPTDDLPFSDSCTVTVTGDQVSDVDVNDPPDVMVGTASSTFTVTQDPCTLPITTIPAIQGTTDTSPFAGQVVTTRGVVVGDFEGASPALRGLYIQDAAGDGNDATSDGLFVFTGGANRATLGDVVTVTGTASEFQGQTQISSTSTVVCSSGSTVAPTDVVFPVASPTFLERYEGMLVQLPQEMTVTEHFQLGRFGQVTLSQGGRLAQPTNVVAPGAPAAALQADNNLRKIILDDDNQAQNADPIKFGRGGQPLSATNTLRGGDTATGIVGVLDFTWGGQASSPNAYRVRPIGAMGGVAEFQPTNERPTASPTIDASTRVVGMNLLNYFNSFSGCTGGVDAAPLDCRGANNATEFARQTAKTVAAVTRTNADVVAFMEMENDGYGAASTEAFLVSKLNEAAGGNVWAFIDPDQATGQVNSMGSDAIKVGLLYKPAHVTPVGTTAVLNTLAFVNAGTDSPKNRPSLAQAFRDNETGGIFVGVANHLKSKGSGCNPGGTGDDQGDGQGNCNGARTYAAGLLADWLASDPTGTGDSDTLIMGDLNSYAHEDPITALKSAGFHNLIEEEHGTSAYSYVFDGQWGYLDHAIGSDSLKAQVAGVEDWHINADEPAILDYNTEFKSAGQVTSLYAPDEFRISDHDPVVVGLDLVNDPPVIGAVTGPTTSVGSVFSLSTSFTDEDLLDTHTSTIDWGDGSPVVAGTLTEAAGAGTITGGHTYANAGLYTVTVTVTDGFNTVTKTQRAVIYDAAAGFTSGGGWFSSPAGALVANPSAEGKGKFDFNVSYASGATTPAGYFTFTLDGSPFSVAATSFDWLVVEGHKATFSGPVTVNGATGYVVEVVATDNGQKNDKLSVVVRDPNGAIVYNSGTQTIQGSVVAH